MSDLGAVFFSALNVSAFLEGLGGASSSNDGVLKEIGFLGSECLPTPSDSTFV